jgi:hypothetical protein
MDHDGARRLMAEGVEGRLEAGDERELALHLVGCVECKRLYDGLQHAHPALAAIAAGPPPTKAVDTAVKRATTVLRGEADPGPLGRPPKTATPPDPSTPAIPTFPAPSDKPSWATTTGPLLGDDAIEKDESPPPTTPSHPPSAPSTEPLVEASIAAPHVPPPPPPPTKPAAPPVPTPEPHDEPRDTGPLPSSSTPPKAQPLLPPTVPPAPPSVPQAPTEPVPKPGAPDEDEPLVDRPRSFELPLRPPPSTQPLTPATPVSPPPTRISSSPLGPPVSRRDEVEQLLDEDYEMGPAGPAHGPEERREVGAGPWLAAIAVTIALAILAAVLITRGQGIIGGGGALPEAEEVRSRVGRVFADLKSLKTSFSIRKLSLYRLGTAGQSLTYSFANGRYAGRMVYDRAEGYRQEITLNVNDREVERAKIVQTDDETRSQLGTDSSQLLIERRPPLGPPDGSLRPSLGILEESIGAAVNALVTADSIEIVGRTTQDGRELYEVHAAMTPNELTRGDRLEMFLDAQTYFPAIIRRTISKVDAGVLGPPDVLTDDAISTAFGDRERITSELVELDNTVVDDIILPGDFVLDTPSGSQPQTRDRGFERVTRAQVGTRLPYRPLFPRSLPDGFSEELVAFSGDERGWGPGGRYPAPDGIMHATYFDGKTTIAVTQRNITSGPFNLDGSPLQSGGLPIQVRPFERAEKRLFFGVSPEVPPHAYGFLGNVFVMVSGYAPAEDLIAVLASLGEDPGAAPTASPGVSASPGAATASPAATPSPAASPTASPAASP